MSVEILNTNLNNLNINKTDKFLQEKNDIIYKEYPGEEMIQSIIDIMQIELSEPYPIFTYRYFLDLFPQICIMAYTKENKFIGCVVGETKVNKNGKVKAYIAMLAVDKSLRGKGIGKTLIEFFIEQCVKVYKVNEIYLETEVSNVAALNLYNNLGFVKTKLLYNYYLNGNDAYRLKLWVTDLENKEE
jgi:peptide alpha-N-acetyltransferase